MSPSRSQEADPVDDRSGAIDAALVICGHGSHLNADSSSPIYDHAARIRDRETFSEVREAFWKEEPSLRNALRTVEAEDVIVVPLFVSEGYFTDGVIPRELRLHERADRSATGDDADAASDGDDCSASGADAFDVAKRVWYTDPVGTHPSMTNVIVDRAERITSTPDVGPGTGLAVIGHGTERNPKSAEAIREHAARVDERERFAAVEALFMDQAPFVDEIVEYFNIRSIVAVPLFIADGFHTREEIPELLGLAGEYPDYENPSDVHDHQIWYTGAVGTELSFANVIAERAEEALSRAPDVDDRRPDPTDSSGRADETDGTPASVKAEVAAAREAFVERVDQEIAADGASLWGEVAITAGPDADTEDGPRAYELRHRADSAVEPTALDTHTDPYRAQDVARFDDEGEYRPLKSAPTLARGWRLAALGARELHRAISYLYPASIENWYRERCGTFDVTDYADTAARQTGMYDPVDELEGPALDRAVRACCTDDVCLKRRVWEASGDTANGADDADSHGREIDAPPGDGEFPCREPCSLFIAAAREFVRADRRDEPGETDRDGDPAAVGRPVLTETDRADLDVILTALAEDPAGVTPVRDGEASEPTNRYRVRYLREKLRDLDGSDRGTDHGAKIGPTAPNPGGED